MRQEILLEKQKMSQGRKENRQIIGFTLKMGGKVIFWTVIFLLLLTVVSVNKAKNRGEIPGILGFHLFVVESGSMEPTLNIGAVILCRKPKEPNNLIVNDIVTFKDLSGHIITHRIIEVVVDERITAYRTKGDNPKNSADRELLTSDRVVAVFIGKIPLT